VAAVLLVLALSPIEAAAAPRGGSITVNPRQPVFGYAVTFTLDVGTAQPYVLLYCWQGATLILYETHAYFAPAYPDSAAFVLTSRVAGTEGSCTARVYKLAKNGARLLAETSFTVRQP
jgi:hypothetical protein